MKQIAVAVAVLGISVVTPMAAATAAPAFGPGRWAVYETGPDAVADPVGNWQVSANCGANCLTVADQQAAGDSKASAQFLHHPDGTWTGSWRVTDGACYDNSGELTGATATWTSSFTIRTDLTVADHIIDEVGCDGGRSEYDETYTLTRALSPERVTP